MDHIIFTLNFLSVYNEGYRCHREPVFCTHEARLREILAAISQSQREVRLTFDDGHLSDYDLVLPLLQEFGLDASFFVLGKSISENPRKHYQTQLIHEAGFRIGSHGYTHVDLTLLSPKELEFELRASKEAIENCIGAPVEDFALPMGRGNKRVNEALFAAGYQRIYTTKSYPSAVDSSLVHRINVKNNTRPAFIREAVIEQRPWPKWLLLAQAGIKNTLNRCL